MTDMQERQSPPALPGVEAGTLVSGKVIGILKKILYYGFPVAARFTTSVRVGSGAAALAAIDGLDGVIVADGAAAGFFARDRANSAQYFGWYESGAIRLNNGASDLWLVDRATGLIAQDAYTAPTLLNSWANFGAGFTTAGYRTRKPDGDVQLKGLIKSGTMAAAAFTLPVALRPGTTRIFPSTSNSAFAEVRIDTSGNVIPTIGSNVYITLDNIIFTPGV